MKQLIKRSAGLLGVHLYSDRSLPTGVHWLHDIRRSGLIGPRPMCFDVGANVGQTVLELKSSFPDAVIHAFEPFAAPFGELTKLACGRRGITPVSLALGAQAGSIEVQPRELSVLNSLVQQIGTASDRPMESIRIETVDRYCTEHAVEAIDILKTDTEGYDLDVLRGADSMLRHQRVTFVHTEVTFQRANQQNTPFQPIFDWLTTHHSYCFLGLYETYPLHNFEEPNLFCNALFVSRAARQRVVAGRVPRGASQPSP